MKSIATITTILVLMAPLSASTYLYRLDSVDKSDVDCGCTFFRSKVEGELELYLAGSEVLFFNFTSDPPRALVNFGQGNVELYLEERSSIPFNSCESGEPFSSEWRLDELTISTHLVAALKDGEACWFGGRLRVERSGTGIGSADISGACQCEPVRASASQCEPILALQPSIAPHLNGPFWP